MKECDYNHLLLYAKRHYVRGDVIQDVKRILAHRCGVESVSDEGMWHMLTNALLQYAGAHIERFLDSIFKPLPDESKYPVFAWFVDSCPLHRAVQRVLFELHTVKVIDADGNKILELGKPDPAILPVSESSNA